MALITNILSVMPINLECLMKTWLWLDLAVSVYDYHYLGLVSVLKKNMTHFNSATLMLDVSSVFLRLIISRTITIKSKTFRWYVFMVTIWIVYLTVIRANDEWELDFALKVTTAAEMFLRLSFQMTSWSFFSGYWLIPNFINLLLVVLWTSFYHIR